MDGKEKVKIGDYLKKIRLKENLNQAEFAEKLEVPRSTYANYESNKRVPSFDFVAKVDSIFGTDIFHDAFSTVPSVYSISQNGEIVGIVNPEQNLRHAFQEFLNAYLRYDKDYTEGYALFKHEKEYIYNAVLSVLKNYLDYMFTIPINTKVEIEIKNAASQNLNEE